MPEPLPINPYEAGTPTHQAYATCERMEVGFPLPNWSGPPTIACARLLGYMIVHSPTDDGRTNITNEINSCNSNELALHKLAKFYVDKSPSSPPPDSQTKSRDTWQLLLAVAGGSGCIYIIPRASEK